MIKRFKIRQPTKLIILFTVFIFGSAFFTPQQNNQNRLLKDVDGAKLQKIIKSYEGERAVIVNVWATWCAPCVEEFPELVKLQREYPDQLRVVFVSADFPDSRGRALKFLKEQNVDWTTYFKVGSDQPFIEALSSSWSGALPYTKVIGKSGEVVASWEQSAGYQKFKRYAQTAIKQ